MTDDDRLLLERLRAESILTVEVIDSVEEMATRDGRSVEAVLDELGHDSRTLFETPAPGRARRRDLQDAPTTGEYLGDYQILDKLGEGGMGVVYRAVDMRLGRDVALKLLLSGHRASDRVVERFQREANVIARLDHPNVIGIYEIHRTGPTLYFTMNLVRGGSLRRAMVDGRVGVDEGVRIVEAVARALAHTHEHAIVHRDVKPENILLETDGTPILTDFGLAREEEPEAELTRTGTILGTPAYMSPEQAAGDGDVGPLADVYALGAVLYEIATGAPPFGREASIGVLRRIAEDEPLRPRILDPSIPRDVETIALACLEKKPERRYASAAALADDLGRYRAGEPIHARPVGLLERTWKRIRRHRTLVATAAAGLLLTGVVGGLTGVRAWREAAARDRAEAETLRLLEERERAAQEELERLRRRSEARPAYERGRAMVDALGSVDPSVRDRVAAGARDHLDRALEIDPRFADAYHVRGRLLEEQRRNDEALADYRTAYALEPGHLPARYRAGFVLVVGKVDHEAGHAEFRAIDEIDPESAYGHLGRAFIAVFEERWADAEASARAALDLDPYLADAYFELGYIEQQRANLELDEARRERLEGADSAYSRALVLRPGDAWSLGNRGAVRELLGRTEEARADYDRALELDSAFSSAYLNRGLLLFRHSDDVGAAIADVRRSLELNDGSARGWINLGTMLISAGQLDEAARALDRGRGLAPDDAHAAYQRGRIHHTLGQIEEARALYRLAVELGGAHRPEVLDTAIDALRSVVEPAVVIDVLDRLPDRVADATPVLKHRSICLLQLGRTDEAAPLLDEVIERAPTAFLIQTRSGLRERAGDVEAAWADLVVLEGMVGPGEGAMARAVRVQFSWRHAEYLEQGLAAAREALEIDPDYVYGHYLLGTTLAIMERPAEALEVFDRYVALAPGDPDGHENRGRILIQVGRTADALTELEGVVESTDDPAQAARLEPLIAALRKELGR